ncbi:hypothetical protein SAMN02982927_00008 [Sporolactobacillus nakayamae]|uniref:Uncharacterized protein n=1 Tax=Sporolactobacillus nakayamae TaxID=269670 RepID=A0A1I2MPI7_9BACL|nr:hypothetical protein SAMN02982927_00008 [Sporolactobacillus nakayamae]
MVSGLLLLVYSLACLTTGFIYLTQNKNHPVIYFFILTHCVSLVLSVSMFMYSVTRELSIPILLLCLISRVSNGYFLFHRIHIRHHALTFLLFLFIVIMQSK